MRLKAQLGLCVAIVGVIGIWCGGSRLLARTPNPQNPCLATTAYGSIQGIDMGASCAFLGIPYALPPTQGNRWKAPRPLPAGPPAIVNALAPPPSCSANENCLFLNIWVSKSALNASAPVLVWFHTGSFVAASANFPGSNGQKLAETKGLVVVAPNYRLGAMGFLVHSALAAESPDQVSGNYGLQDQREALKWVRDHISAFGGDPYEVTIAGTSAGGDSVGFHLVSPLSRGLFHRAIVQSGSPTIRWPTHQESLTQGDAFAAALGCNDPAQVAACLRSKTLAQVTAALPLGSQQVLEQAGRVFWSPVVDHHDVPDQPRILFEKSDFNRVPILVGTNRDEMWGNFLTRSFPSGVTAAQYEAWLQTEFGSDAGRLLQLYPVEDYPSPAEALARVAGDVQYVCETRRLARLVERTEKSIYVYSYEYEIDELSVDHVVHGLESNILFANNFVAPQTAAHALTPEDLVMHQIMSGYWAGFISSGNPNANVAGAVEWPPFRHPTGNGRGADKYLVLDSPAHDAIRAQEEQCDGLEQYFFRSVIGSVPASAP